MYRLILWLITAAVVATTPAAYRAWCGPAEHVAYTNVHVDPPPPPPKQHTKPKAVVSSHHTHQE